MFTLFDYDAGMPVRKPFRAVPITLGKRYRREAKAAERKRVAKVLAGAALCGAILGTGSLIVMQGGLQATSNVARPAAVSLGLERARAPQEGDYWSGCDVARAAGTAPIFIGEPGYREGLDGDSDGIACEPYRF
ncbi:excalibur calcium-binding domain-containing protein [Tsuneonella amylolytica]|uniref:excalibur calcium-binding domain-containing protein n=1 Tax=Tsuneonella amylolytica TaxID=2338327 RepID=UPI002D770777|nr:excalibur calcium-binding domain-containing protein [Tsuneonella amylolytica]